MAAQAEIYMPQLGLTMTEGKIIRWLKAAGDPVKRGEPVVEIETDKVTAEVEAPADGVLGPILAPEGVSVPIGGLLSHVLAPGGEHEGLPRLAASARTASAPAAGRADTPAGPIAAQLATAPIGGEAQTPRQSRPFASPRARHKAVELGIDLARVEASGPGGRIVEADVRWFADHVQATASPLAPRQEARKASPLARRIAQELGVDLAQVAGSGPGGRIVEEDVRRAAAQQQPAPPAQLAPAPPQFPQFPHFPPPASASATRPLSGIRRVVADRMALSFSTAPHFYLSAEVEAAALTRMREGLLGRVEAATGARLTITDILVKVCAQALREFPQINAAWDDTSPGGGIRRLAEVNVGLAVSLDDGLVVPVVRRADQLTLAEIARQRSDLVARARAGRLALADLEGGSFTLSNLGMYAVDQFAAIINPPQGAILAVGRIKERPVVVDGHVVARPTLVLTLSLDHRVLDGAQGARFLERVGRLIQEPYLLVA